MASINESWNKLKSLMLYAKRPSEELEKIRELHHPSIIPQSHHFLVSPSKARL